ncbi:MAG: hypothetical protein HFJ45_09020 [Clostridia bacterium]|nr:hypothetical protein [Clostridia bacterium]
MKSMKLFKAIGKIDDKFIIEEEKNIEKEKIQVPIFKRFAMAGLALTIILGISITTYAMVIEKEYNAAVGYLNSLGISVEDLSDYSKSEIIKTVDAYQNYGDSEIVNNLLKNEEIISSPINITSEQVKKLKPTMTYTDVKKLLGDTQDIGSGIYILYYIVDNKYTLSIPFTSDNSQLGVDGEDLLKALQPINNN